MNHKYFTLLAAMLSTGAMAAPRPYENPRSFGEAQEPGALQAGAARAGCSPETTVGPNGHRHVRLRVRWTDPKIMSIFNPNADPSLHEPERDPVELRSYNGCLVGPTIETRPDDTLFVDLSNELNDAAHPTDPSCVDPQHNQANCFNTVNLHFHGYHGSPSSSLRWGPHGRELIASDDIFIETAPGGAQRYEYRIGRDHPAGTFWYHAHRHGSTAMTVTSGMAGALIVRGSRTVEDKLAGLSRVADVDTVLPRDKVRERILVLEQISYACLDASGNVVTKAQAGGTAGDGRWHCTDDGQLVGGVGEVQNFNAQLNGVRNWDASGRYTAINGEVRPPIGTGSDVIRAGDLERWRIIHAGIRDAVNLRIVAVDETAAAAALAPSQTLTPATRAKVQALQTRSDKAAALRDLLHSAPAGQAGRAERAEIIKGVCNGPVVRQVDIAEDGLTRSAAVEKTTSYLQPGYRTDLLLAFPKSGLYCVLDETESGANRPSASSDGAPAPDKSLELLTTVLVGDGTPIDAINAASDTSGMYQAYALGKMAAANGLPAAVKARLTGNDLSDYAFAVDFDSPHQPAPQTPVRTLDYIVQVTPAPGGPPTVKFGWTDAADLSGFQQHDATAIPFAPVLGSVETWNLSANQTHIHHIHVNPFKILDIRNPAGVSIFGPGGDCSKVTDPGTGAIATDEDAAQYCGLKGAYKDTVFLKGDPAGTAIARYVVVAQTKYEEFPGEFVLHCHILDHEDQGMMANVCVHRPGQQCQPGPHALPGAALSMGGM